MNGPDAFTAEWADAWCRALNGSDAYRSAAARWEGDVVLVMTDGAPERTRAVYLDLQHGRCGGARVATADDCGGARYVLEAERETWRELLAGRTPPLMALMTNRLRITRGSLAALMPLAGAAGELVRTAAAMETRFEEG